MAKKTVNWIPKTALGKKVMSGEITDINQVFAEGHIIREPEVVDMLIPTLEEEIIYIGGVPGKGGGIKRTPLRVTTRMHQSGRKRTIHSLVAVGNLNGILGLGYATGEDARRAIEKATKKAKLNLITIRRGCGSWECGCGTAHSIPMKTGAKVGSVDVKLLPAPKGVRLAVANEVKKLMRLAGIKDVWEVTRGQTKTRLNFIRAVFKALGSLNEFKVNDEYLAKTGLKEGVIR